MEKKTQIIQTSIAQLFKDGHIDTFDFLKGVKYSKPEHYPFLTCLRGNKATNLWFGQKSAQKIPNMSNEAMMAAMATGNIVQTINEDGELRFKISLSGDSDYASETEMQKLFGKREVSSPEIDTALFRAIFTEKEEAVSEDTPKKGARVD